MTSYIHSEYAAKNDNVQRVKMLLETLTVPPNKKLFLSLLGL